VLGPDKEMFLDILAHLPKQISGSQPWLFILHFNTSMHEKIVKEIIEEEFSIFKSIAFNSRINVQVLTIQRIFFFEVYRVTPNSNLTITLMCLMNSESLKVDFLNTKDMWQRRNNLAEVNLKIGIMFDDQLVVKGSEVTFRFKRFFFGL
jgi:hypothetical protein